ncbi:MAG TPA: hypothetical protein VFD58_20150 [Blastocatellia bacterium]|nr:hypothetical protein [Blastocatellia bacterium]
MTPAKGHQRIIALSLALSVCAGLLLAGGLKLFTHHSLSAFEAEAEEANERDAKPLADAWFYEQRAYPLKDIPQGARSRAVEQLEFEERRLRGRHALSAESADGVNADPAWQLVGPMPIANGNTGPVSKPVTGRVSAIALDPGYNGTSNQTVYLGAAQGGVWRTRDNGATWAPLIDDQPSLAVGSLAIDPANADVIYVGTGEGNGSADSYYGAGLLKSVNGGTSWSVITGPNSTSNPQVPAFINAAITRIAIDPTNTQTIYLCTRTGQTYGASGGQGSAPLGQRGVWKSTDGGATWANLDPTSSGGGTSANDLIIDPQNSSRVYAGMLAQGIYRSTSGGTPGSWEKLTSNLPATDIGRITLAVGPPLAPSTSATLYAAIANNAGSSLRGIYRSTDNGTTWNVTNSTPSAGSTFYNLTLAVDPTDANIVYFGEVSFTRTTDGGNTWVNQASGNGNGNGGLHVDQHAMAISPANRNILFSGNDGGIWRTDNATDTTIGWNNLNQVLSITQFQSVALHPLDINYLIGGTQDNGTNRFTGSASWTRVAGGDGGFALVDQSNPTTVYHSFQNTNTGGTNPDYGPRVSSNSGTSWTDRGCRGCTATQGNLNPTDRVGFYSPMALHTGFTQAPGNVIYWGTQRLYRSADTGQTWTGLGPSTDGFGADLSKGSGRLSAIAAYPKLDTSVNPPGEIVWVGTSDGNVQVTTNAGALSGATFTNVTKAPLPNRFVTEIVPDPNNAQRVYVTYSGFNFSTQSTPGHVFVTNDQGATWTNMSGNLPDIPVTSLAIDPFKSNTFYVGTDIGVFQTTDGGTTWARLGNGMPKVAVFMVRYHEATRSLIAATHGRGIFRLAMANAVTTVSAANYSRTALAPEGIAAAFGVGLATTTAVAPSIPLPTNLAGTTVKVRDLSGTERLAGLFFVSLNQVNYQIPPGTLPGPVAVTITSGDGTISTGSEQVAATAPSLFAANASGNGLPAGFVIRVRSGVQTLEPVAQFDGTLVPPQFVPVPVDLGPQGDIVVLVLYGTGIRGRSALPAVKATVGGTDIQPDYASVAPGFVGLDQVNATLPRSLIGRGDVSVVLTADGKSSNTLTIRIK